MKEKQDASKLVIGNQDRLTSHYILLSFYLVFIGLLCSLSATVQSWAMTKCISSQQPAHKQATLPCDHQASLDSRHLQSSVVLLLRRYFLYGGSLYQMNDTTKIPMDCSFYRPNPLLGIIARGYISCFVFSLFGSMYSIRKAMQVNIVGFREP